MHSSEMKGPPLAPCLEGECATEVLVVPEPMGGRRKPILRICEVPGGDFAPQKAPRARCYPDGQVSLHRARQALEDRRGLVCLSPARFWYSPSPAHHHAKSITVATQQKRQQTFEHDRHRRRSLSSPRQK